jgi:hypothetical protein
VTHGGGGVAAGSESDIKTSKSNGIVSAHNAIGASAIANTIKTTPKYLLEMTVLFISITSYPVRKPFHLRRGDAEKDVHSLFKGGVKAPPFLRGFTF